MTATLSAPSAPEDSATNRVPPKALPVQPPGIFPDGPGHRREICHPGLLLTSLQRVYRTGDARLSEQAGAAPARAAASSSDVAHGLAIGLIETVFEIGDLDPFPFANRRDDSAEIELKSKKPPMAAELQAGKRQMGAQDAPSVPPSEALAMAHESESNADRRKLPRRESDCSVQVSPAIGSERLSPERTAWILRAAKTRGQLIDVSMSGVAVQLTEEIAPGTRVVLRIVNRTLSKHVDAVATVLRCRQDGKTGWSVVCRFDKNLTFEQIHLIGRNLFAHTIV